MQTTSRSAALKGLTSLSTAIRTCHVTSLDNLTIPDDNRESAWKFPDLFADYINQHAKQDAEKLGGSYGMKDGLMIAPANRTIEAPALPAQQNPTGRRLTLK